MIQMGSVLQVADNSGAKSVLCVKVLGGSKKFLADIGDIIVVSIKNAIPRSKVVKGEVHKAIIVRTKSSVRRVDGTRLSFANNAVVLLNKNFDPIGTRIDTISREMRDKSFVKFTSLASEVW